MRKLYFIDTLLIFLALIVLAFPAIQPFLQGEMPRTNDGALYLYRVVALDHALTVDDLVLPRYLPGIAYGYGAPLFNYNALTPHLPTQLLHALGLDFVTAWLWTVAGITLLAAVGAYALGAFWTGTGGGFVAAAAYVYAPYFLFDTITRGSVVEAMALALLPGVLWTFGRLARDGQRRDFALAVIALAVFIPVHNITTVYGVALLGAYGLVLLSSTERPRRALFHMLVAGLFALALSAFFWWPALAEADFVKIDGVMQNLSFVDVTRSLRPLGEILELPHTADPSQLEQPTPIVVGWPPIALTVVGLALAWRHPNRHLRWVTTFAALAALIVIFMNTPAAAALWKNVPLIGFSQFAWRTLGIGSLALALGAGIGAHLMARRIGAETRKIGLFCGFTAVLVIYSVPWLYTAYLPDFAANDIRDAQAHERSIGEMALSSFSEYTPIWNAEQPEPDKLIPRYDATPAIPRLEPPPGVTLLNADWRGTSADLRLQVEDETRLIFDWLYFPGWQAQITTSDGSTQAAPVTPTTPEGLVAVDVPAGDYSLSIALQRTPTQTSAEAVSLAALVAFAITVIAWRGGTVPQALVTHNKRLIAAMIVTGAGVFALKSAVIDRVPNPLRAERFPEGAEIAPEADFSGLIHLLEFGTAESVTAPETAVFRLFWRLADHALETDYSSIVHLRDDAGHVVAEAGSFMPGDVATSNWVPEFYVAETITLSVPINTPPGPYTVDVGLYDPITLQPLDVINAAGNPAGVTHPIGTLTVERPSRPAAQAAPADAIVQNGLILTGINGLPETVTVGDPLTIAWTWRTQSAPEAGLQARLAWGCAAPTLSPAVPLIRHYDTGNWQPGDIWTGYHTIFVPGNLDAGKSCVGVVFAGDDTPLMQRPITIQTPERTLTPPDPETPLSIPWANGLHLLGADTAGVSVLTLHWRTDAPINASLRLFVHLLDADGRIVAVSDGVPVNWTRPTSGWAVGEFIATDHPFADAPPGTYRVRVGWVDPSTGERVQLGSERQEDSALLPLEVVIP